MNELLRILIEIGLLLITAGIFAYGLAGFFLIV
jgi:hypothetical protein